MEHGVALADVEATGDDVADHKGAQPAPAEVIQDVGPGELLHLTMECRDLHPARLELEHSVAQSLLVVHEDKHPLRIKRMDTPEARQGRRTEGKGRLRLTTTSELAICFVLSYLRRASALCLGSTTRYK